MTAKIINGRAIAQQLKDQVAKDIKNLIATHHITPQIVTVKIGHDPSSELYLKLRDKACNEVGIISNHVEFDEDISQQNILREISRLNNDDKVHGILVQYPVPLHISSNRLMAALDPRKDVEGFHPYNSGQILLGNELIIPCTPAAVLTILDHEHVTLKGKNMVIINHSNVVGKPLSTLLLNRDATVSVCHIFTKNLKEYTQQADICISAAGKAGLLTKDHIQKGAFVIDVGIIPTDKGVCGDVDFNTVKEKAGKLTPVPGGVGPVTIACALQNMIKTYKNCIKEKEKKMISR